MSPWLARELFFHYYSFSGLELRRWALRLAEARGFEQRGSRQTRSFSRGLMVSVLPPLGLFVQAYSRAAMSVTYASPMIWFGRCSLKHTNQQPKRGAGLGRPLSVACGSARCGAASPSSNRPCACASARRAARSNLYSNPSFHV